MSADEKLAAASSPSVRVRFYPALVVVEHAAGGVALALSPREATFLRDALDFALPTYDVRPILPTERRVRGVGS